MSWRKIFLKFKVYTLIFLFLFVYNDNNKPDWREKWLVLFLHLKIFLIKILKQQEVDEFLDDVIKDYETYSALVKELREENSRLKQELSKRMQEAPNSTASQVHQSFGDTTQTTITNFDILKRLSRLEKEVFGKQIQASELNQL